MNLLEALMAYGEKTGAIPLNKWPGCWEAQIDEQWWIAVNAHQEAMACTRGTVVQPFTFYIEFNGWPAGIIDCAGRGEFAAGATANLASFTEALERAA